MVRGQWIMEPHSKAEKTAMVDCWISTGSIAPIDAQGRALWSNWAGNERRERRVQLKLVLGFVMMD